MEQKTLKFNSTIISWDEGLPLGNGDIGCLIWGKAKALRFSLDKGDIWDTSNQPSENPNFNYEKLKQWAKDGDKTNIHKTFDACYNSATPTKLPVGAIVVELSSNANVISELNMLTAEASLSVENIKIRSIAHSDMRVGLIDINSEDCNIRLDIPHFGKKKKGWWSKFSSRNITQSLQNLHYEKYIFKEKTICGIDYKSFIQKVNETFNYGVVVGIKKDSDGTHVAYTIVCSNDGKDYEKKAFDAVAKALNCGYNKLALSHKKWWMNFWNQSDISLPDKTLERCWNVGNYLLGSGSRKGCYPMPLQGLWTADNGSLPPWKGDYHHDLNTQLTYFSYTKSNHIEQGECFVDYLLNLKNVGIRFAKDFYGVEGLCLPSVMDINGGALGGWAMYSLSPTNMLWLCDIIAKHFDYTLDTALLKDKIMPYFALVEKFFTNMFVKKNGRLYLPLSSSSEIHGNAMKAFLTPNSNYDLALMRKFYLTLLKFCDRLNLPSEEYKKTLSMLDDLTVKNNILALSPDEMLKESHRHHSHAMGIFPLRLLDYDKKDERAIIDSTIENLEKLGTKAWVGYSFAWLAEFYVIQRNGDKAAKTLKDFFDYFCLPNGFHINGDYTKQGLSDMTYRPFTLEGNFCAVDAIQEMLLYSHNGIIEPLRAIPKEWKDFHFSNLRAEGAVLVSLNYADGQLTDLTLFPTKTLAIQLVNKFERQFVCSSKYEEKGKIISLQLVENEKVVFRAST